MAPSKVLKKSDSHASEAEAVLDLELVKQASSRVADAESLASGEALYEFAQENLKGFATMFPGRFAEQAEVASCVSLTWASACSGSEGAFYVMEALSRAYSLSTETCGFRLSVKHLFSCESNKDKQRWIQAVLDCGPLMPALSPLKSASEGSDGESELLQLGSCIFQDIETLGGCEAHCVVHGKLCPVPGCETFWSLGPPAKISARPIQRRRHKSWCSSRAIHWEAQRRLTTVLPAMLQLTHLGW